MEKRSIKGDRLQSFTRQLGPVLYLLYTADLPIVLGTITATYTDDIAILAAHNNHIEASLRLQESLFYIEK